jgi:hypothetical protein
LARSGVSAEGFELPAFWFVANGVKMLNALFGVAYSLETPFSPRLAARNIAPKTELDRPCTIQFIGSILKAQFGLGERILNHRPPSRELGWEQEQCASDM